LSVTPFGSLNLNKYFLNIECANKSPHCGKLVDSGQKGYCTNYPKALDECYSSCKCQPGKNITYYYPVIITKHSGISQFRNTTKYSKADSRNCFQGGRGFLGAIFRISGVSRSNKSIFSPHAF